MAKICTLCGCELPRFGGRSLTCCSTEQPVCKTCYDELVDLTTEERGRRILATGRARDEEDIRAFLSQMEAREQRKQEATRTGKVCLRCGAPMVKMGQKQFQLGEHGFFLGDLSHLMAGSLTLDILSCQQCRKVEFFLPEDESNT